MQKQVSPLARVALWLGGVSLTATSLVIPTTAQAQSSLNGGSAIPPLKPIPESTYIPPAAPVSTPSNPTSQALATHIVLVLGERRVYAYQNDKVLASYPVAVGKKGWETPQGNFQVIQMVENPVWENPWNGKKVAASLDGPIGIRWIGFWSDGKNTIGFHGTPKKHEHFLGTAASHGCVRMRNQDVVALFNMVQNGTPVRVVQKK